MAALMLYAPLALSQESQAPPSLDFLEYLADLEQVDGEWVDGSESGVEPVTELAGEHIGQTGSEQREKAIESKPIVNEHREEGK